MSEYFSPIFIITPTFLSVCQLDLNHAKKLYIAYKLDTNFVDIIIQKTRLRLSVNMKYSDVIDPKGLCSDITDKGRWGNGDVARRIAAFRFNRHGFEHAEKQEIIL